MLGGHSTGCHHVPVPVKRMRHSQRPKAFSAQKAAETIVAVSGHPALPSSPIFFSPFPSRARAQRSSSHWPHPLSVHHPAHAQPRRQRRDCRANPDARSPGMAPRLHHPQSLPCVCRRKRGRGEGEAWSCSHLFTFPQGILHENSTLQTGDEGGRAGL